MKLKEHGEAFRWLVNRLHKKYKIPKSTTEEVLFAIADLEWDWSRSKYDLGGIQIEEILREIGIKRAPKEEET